MDRRKGGKEGEALTGCDYSPQDMHTIDLRFRVQAKPDPRSGSAHRVSTRSKGLGSGKFG